jgi:hypothetical protein
VLQREATARVMLAAAEVLAKQLHYLATLTRANTLLAACRPDMRLQLPPPASVADTVEQASLLFGQLRKHVQPPPPANALEAAEQGRLVPPGVRCLLAMPHVLLTLGVTHLLSNSLQVTWLAGLECLHSQQQQQQGQEEEGQGLGQAGGQPARAAAAARAGTSNVSLSSTSSNSNAPTRSCLLQRMLHADAAATGASQPGPITTAAAAAICAEEQLLSCTSQLLQAPPDWVLALPSCARVLCSSGAVLGIDLPVQQELQRRFFLDRGHNSSSSSSRGGSGGSGGSGGNGGNSGNGSSAGSGRGCDSSGSGSDAAAAAAAAVGDDGDAAVFAAVLTESRLKLWAENIRVLVAL